MKPLQPASALADLSDELEALLGAAVDGIILIDHVGSIHRFNRSAERLFGYAAAEVLGRNVSLLMAASDRARHDEYLARYAATRVPHIIGKGRDVSAQRKDGTVFPALLSVGVVPGSEPLRYVGFVHDITDRRNSEDEALRLRERLMHVSRLATVGEMASGIAHELNQPLAAIATYAHACDRLLSLPQPDIEEIQLALKEIAAQAVRAGDIIRRLRNLARDEDQERRPADINAVIAELADLIDSDARAHGVTYRTDLGTQMPQVAIDRAQIQQVILNLVRNAFEAFVGPKPPTMDVAIRTRPTSDGGVEIVICDNGPGVASDIAARMFDPFCSTKAAGTGLGLAISRTIARTHGGALDYRPNTPTGACFIVRLPSLQKDEA